MKQKKSNGASPGSEQRGNPTTRRWRALDHEDGERRRFDEMVAGAAEPTAKRAKKDKEDPLVRRRNELILGVAHARVAMKAKGNKAVREAT